MSKNTSIILEEKLPIAGGQIIRANLGHGGCIEITETQSGSDSENRKINHESERIVARITAAHRAAVAAFFKEAN